MNKEYIQKFKNEVKLNVLSDIINEREINYIDKIFNDYFNISPRNETNEIVYLDLSSNYSEEIKGISLKIENICLNLKEAIVLAIESSLDFETPDNSVALIKLAIKLLLKAYIVSSIRIEYNDCLLLLYLHNNNAYKTPVCEDKILEDIENGILKLSKEDYYKSIRNLMKISSALVICGEIYLKERVILKY